MHPHRLPRRVRVAGALLALATVAAAPGRGGAQDPATPPTATLTLREARDLARRTSPELRALREAIAVATGRERQAGAPPNPTLAYGHERTSRDGARNAQHIAQLEQPLELAGQRGARREAARLAREAAEARLSAAGQRLDYDVVRAYALAVAAERRAMLAAQAADAFVEAQRVSERRLATGDVSGYADRRLRLEAARYAAQRTVASLARRTARLELASLLGAAPDSVADRLVLADSALVPGVDDTSAAWARLPAMDSLQRLARARRPDLHALTLEQRSMQAAARLAARERFPVPTVAAGLKAEEAVGGGDGFRGFVAGFSVPLPIWDRRAGAVQAADAEARRATADRESLERQVAREVAIAAAALEAAERERGLLAPHVGSHTIAAMRAVRVAYAEGEIGLLEFLDAVRAYQEAEATWASLRADVLTRRAALERAVGAPLFAGAVAPADRE